MRKLALAVLLATASVVAAASAATSPSRAYAQRVDVGGGVSIRVPPGWYVRRGWLSDVVDPIPRLAVANFEVKLSRHTCACGFPNVERFPRDGAFLFVWEYSWVRRTPRRPARFAIRSFRPTRHTCMGPSDEFDFRDAGRGFQIEVYLGPAASRRTRARLASILDSLRVTAAGPRRSPHPDALRRGS